MLMGKAVPTASVPPEERNDESEPELPLPEFMFMTEKERVRLQMCCDVSYRSSNA